MDVVENWERKNLHQKSQQAIVTSSSWKLAAYRLWILLEDQMKQVRSTHYKWDGMWSACNSKGHPVLTEVKKDVTCSKCIRWLKGKGIWNEQAKAGKEEKAGEAHPKENELVAAEPQLGSGQPESTLEN